MLLKRQKLHAQCCRVCGSFTVVLLTCCVCVYFVMCGCVGNMCTFFTNLFYLIYCIYCYCIYCVLYCLYYVSVLLHFMYILFLFVSSTRVRTTATRWNWVVVVVVVVVAVVVVVIKNTGVSGRCENLRSALYQLIWINKVNDIQSLDSLSWQWLRDALSCSRQLGVGVSMSKRLFVSEMYVLNMPLELKKEWSSVLFI